MNKLQNLKGVSRTRLLLLSLVMALALPMTAYLSANHSQESSNVRATANEPPIFGEIWARTELFFGTNRPNKPPVSDERFQRFIDQQVTPRLPDGLTLLTGLAQFKNSSGVIIQERSKLLILLYPLTDTDASNRIEAIRENYKQTFQQESVLRVDSRAGVSF